MSNIEIVGTTLFYAKVVTAEGIKQAVVELEGKGNVVINITPVYEGVLDGDYSGMDLKAVFIHVAGDAKPLS